VRAKATTKVGFEDAGISAQQEGADLGPRHGGERLHEGVGPADLEGLHLQPQGAGCTVGDSVECWGLNTPTREIVPGGGASAASDPARRPRARVTSNSMVRRIIGAS
jgi:hypothetical protein